jgi:hypothetical protein
MAAQSFRVILTQSAWADLEDIVAYWTDAMDVTFGTPPIQRRRSFPFSNAPTG